MEHSRRERERLASRFANRPSSRGGQKCCRCNGSGSCIRCVCASSGTPCINCLPSKRQHCANSVPAQVRQPTFQPASQPTSHPTRHPMSHGPVSQTVPVRRPPSQNSTQPLFSEAASSTQSPPTMISPADDPPATSEPAEPIINRHTPLLFSEPASPPSPLTHIGEAGETGTPPNAQPSVRRTQNFRWGDLSGNEFVIKIQIAYAEVVHWRQNLFKIPSGRSGKEFTAEMARLLAAFAEASALEDIAVKAAMTLPGLLLQEPSAQSKAKEHAEVLERRMQQWKEGEIQALLQEGRSSNNAFNSRTREAGPRGKTGSRSDLPKSLPSKSTTGEQRQLCAHYRRQQPAKGPASSRHTNPQTKHNLRRRRYWTF